MRILFFVFLLFSKALAAPSLYIYTTEIFASGVGASIKADFEKKYNATVHYITCNGAFSLYQDLILGKKEMDGFVGLSYDLFGAAPIRKLLKNHAIDLKRLSIPFSWEEEEMLPLFYSALGFVGRGDFSHITSFEDLLKLKKKIILIDPRSSNPGFGLLLWVKSIYKEGSASYWKKLKPHILTMPKTWTEAYALFMQKESPIVLSYTTSPAYHRLKEKNLEIHPIRFKEGHFLQIYVGGILKRSKEPTLMQQFLLATLDREAQKKIVFEDWSYPVVEIGEPLPVEFQKQDDFKVPFTPQTIEENKKAWLDEWLDAMS